MQKLIKFATHCITCEITGLSLTLMTGFRGKKIWFELLPSLLLLFPNFLLDTEVSEKKKFRLFGVMTKKLVLSEKTYL